MKKILLVFLSTFIMLSVFSQTTMKTRKWRKTEQDSLVKAQAIFEARNYLVALSYFEKILKNHPDETYLRYVVGICGLYRSDMHEKSLEYLTEAYSKSKKIKDINYDLARAQHYAGQFNEALANIDLYLKEKNLTEIQKKEALLIQEFCNNGLAIVAAPLSAKIQNVGNSINTANSEYSPEISSDESFMTYTYVGDESVGGKQNEMNQPDTLGSYNEDIYISRKENGKWAKGAGIGDNINTNLNDATAGLSNDGQKMFVYRDDGMDGGDIYMSTLQGKAWSIPEKLRGEVNTGAWEGAASLSSDEKTLFFSSERPGGVGGKDIYKATLLSDGSWGNVQNLGIEINTMFDEDAPFIHPDGKTLFYSTVGIRSMGYNDIFVTHLNLADSVWSKPENIGYPINTTDDDKDFVLSADGKHGYSSSAKLGGFGQEDIYSVEMPANYAKPIVETVKGIITLDDKPKEATVLVDIANKSRNYGSFHSNSLTGKYLVNIIPGNNYKFTFKLKGYPDIEKEIDASNLKEFAENVMDIKFITKTDSASATNLAAGNNGAGAGGADGKTDVANNGKGGSSSSLKNKSGDGGNANGTGANGKNSGSSANDKTAALEAKVASKVGNASKEGLVFKIQLGALRSPENFNLGKLSGYGKVEKKLLDDGLTRITVGSFKTLNEALDSKKKIRSSGFPDAFVTAIYNGKRVYLTELETMGLIKLDK